MPTLAYRLATDEGLSWVPLQGMIIGNGFSDPLHMLEYGNFLEGVGLVNREEAEEIRQQTKVRQLTTLTDIDSAFGFSFCPSNLTEYS